jgi:hypothetical protein
VGQVFTAWSDAIPGTLVVSDSDTADKHALTSFEMPIILGRPSHMFLFELSRIGGDAADTYAADAKLIEFDVHYYAGSAGTINELTD